MIVFSEKLEGGVANSGILPCDWQFSASRVVIFRQGLGSDCTDCLVRSQQNRHLVFVLLFLLKYIEALSSSAFRYDRSLETGIGDRIFVYLSVAAAAAT